LYEIIAQRQLDMGWTRDDLGLAMRKERATDIPVLVVDDEDDVREAIVEALACKGYNMLEAADAETGLLQLQARRDIRLLVTDIRLPGMNGIDLAILARRRWPRLRVIAMSGYFAPRSVPCRLLIKPFRIETLVDAMQCELSEPELLEAEDSQW
jgi:two-component system, cell cycle response regulator CpdR